MTDSGPWTVRNLREIDDAAAGHGFGEIQEARFASKELEATRTGLSLQRIKPDRSSAFAHRHREAEEIYVVLSGSGHAHLDGETIELRPLDALRVAPAVVRSFAAGPDGLELLALGAAHPGDAELIPPAG
ncbi:MAG: hypothetical protein AVDCRST_MAG65-999 [uncultured Solirubrobacteraceae bacterium]|uniref:Cupin type-2 domain-containing protein n=1 Tax=uncultured Solirubrobacteraceae bacterium TaxID=1162706 RepID=A0A6J4RI10_9ACTN|nr:MAG: hypothetical protein AVDCRST_MAG65-999 [uncultured Solirubrobacteraceae bacterium]